eukprot:1054717-Pyramimonas_sp.AAC.1
MHIPVGRGRTLPPPEAGSTASASPGRPLRGSRQISGLLEVPAKAVQTGRRQSQETPKTVPDGLQRLRTPARRPKTA